MSRRSRVCGTPGHPDREHPACSGCGCHCHPGKPPPSDFRQIFEHWRDRARAQKETHDDPDHEQP